MFGYAPGGYAATIARYGEMLASEGVKIETSVQRGEITVEAGLTDLAAEGRYALRAEIRDNGRRARGIESDSGR